MAKSILRTRRGPVALLAALGVLSAEAPAQQAPTWTVSKTVNECALTRKVDGPEPSLLLVRSAPGSDTYDLVVGAAKLPPARASFANIDIIFDGPGKMFPGNGQSGNIGANLQAIQLAAIDWTNFAFIRQASAVRLKYDGQTYGPFALPDIADAIAALRDCLGEHLRQMGADPAQFLPGGSPPEPRRSRLRFLTSDQIARAMRAGAPDFGRIYKLTIDTDGRVADCARIAESHGDMVERAVCRMLIGQLLFTPAHDATGKPVLGIATYWLPLLLQRN